MALFELIVRCGVQRTETIREIRKHSSLGVAEIVSRMQIGGPVIKIDTTESVIELDGQEAVYHQHAAVLGAHEVLSRLGNDVTIIYRPGKDYSPPEVVNVEVAKNLMESELIGLRQEYD